MSAVRLAGLDVLSARLALPPLGIGTLEAELDLDEGTDPPSGTVDLTFEAENGTSTVYRVTVLDVLPGGDAGRENVGRHRVFAVQGTGNLREEITGSSYEELSPRLIFEDLLAGEGQDLDGVPDAEIKRWDTMAGAARTGVTRLAASLQLTWRVLPSGVVKVGPETWPEYAGSLPLYTAEPDAYGLCELALDAPDLLPGMSIPPPSGSGDQRKVAEVVYVLTADSFRARVRLVLASGPGDGSTRALFAAAVTSVLPPQRLLVPHLATVVMQEQDGTLGLRLDGKAPPRLSLSSVPMMPGLPGCTITALGGARVVVQFMGGEEDSPVVTGFAAMSMGATVLTGTTAPPVP